MGYPLIYGLSIHEYSRRDVFRLLVRTVKISQYVPSIVFFKKYLVPPLINGKDMKNAMCKT